MRRAAALLISIAALVYAVAVVFVSWQAPDKGFLTFRGRRVTIIDPGSEAENAGFRRGDVVVAVDGEPVESTLEYADRLLSRPPGERVTIEVERAGEAAEEVRRITAEILLGESPLPLGAIAAVVMALMLLALGMLALWTRPGDAAADHFWRSCLVFAVVYAGALSWVHLVVHPPLALIALAALFVGPPVAHDFTTVFPSPLPRARTSRIVVWTISLLLGAGTFTAVALAARARAAGKPGDVWLDWVTRGIAADLAFYLVVVSMGIAIGSRRVRDAIGAEKSQHKWLRFGGALASIPAFAAVPFALADLDRFLIEGYRPFAAALAVLGFATTSLAVLRVRLADVDAVIHRSVTYVIATGGAALVYVGVALGVGAGVESLGATPLAAHLIAALVAAALFGPIRDRVQPWLDRRFFRDRLHYVHALRDLAETMVAIRDPVELARAVVERTVTALRAGSGALYLAREGDPEQRLAHARAGWPERAASPEPPADGVATPVARDGKSYGTLVLGPRLGGDLYSTEDRALLGALAGQLAVAIENAGAFQTITAMTGTLAEQNREIRELRDKLEDENRYLRSRIEQALGTDGALVVGQSARAKELLRQIERVAPTDAVVLLQGETGSGKGVAARMIHAGSERAPGPFIHVDCGAIPAGVFESELFGHERGAFTGAVRARRGFFELADGGTLFLDEIGEFPLLLQPKLLRVLQEREVTRVGGNKALAVDVRIVAATNRSLADMVRRAEFREDLYYRLGVVEIEVPPLRARRTDIPDLIDVLLPRICRRNRRHDLELTDEALARMQAYGWPGNVRELENVLERAVVLAEGRELRAEDLNLPDAPPQVEEMRERASNLPPDAGHRDVMETLEKDRLVAALRAAGGNQSHAARSLGMPRTTLINKMRRYGLG